ncbi:MAG TPA: helix-turn-helix transcriptional regulator [Sphingopyxis sp.]|nr:helix-turn-helix transcriptional regulator [Sphingopyxis sp.]HMP43868.1 helix-turn-helix transcriptional regulator [Sphingopyxis sp.]
MNKKKQTGQPDSAGLAQLTAGEIVCLDAVTAGLASKEIARNLDVSPHTVDARLKSACAKLGTKSRFVAAKILSDCRDREAPSEAGGSDTKLAYEILGLHSGGGDGDERPSAGEGDGPDDLEQAKLLDPDARRVSGSGRSWLEASHPIAKFFGGENRQSIGWRILVIIAMAIGSSIAFSALLNGFVGMSRIASPP